MYQWIYTSTCWGIEHQNGFQVFSYTEGLSREESMELISRIGAYEFPIAASYTNDFVSPISFSHIQLKSGKWVLSQTTPLGIGWMDGRGGNYIVHAVISDTPFEKNPMEYYQSSFFWKDLPEDVKQEGLKILSGEKDWYSYGFLPKVEPSELLPNPEMAPESLITWCDTHSKWDLIAYLLEYFSERIQNRKNVIFRDEQTELPFVLGTLMSFLPEKLSVQLSFSTYMNTRNKLPAVLASYHLIGVTECEGDVNGTLPGEVKNSAILEVNRRYNAPFQVFCTQANVSLEQYKTAADVFLWCQDEHPEIRIEDIPVFVQFLIQNDQKRTLYSDFIDELCKKHWDWFDENHYEMLMEQLVSLVKNSSNSISLESNYPFIVSRLWNLLSSTVFNSAFVKTVLLCGPSFAMYWQTNVPSFSPEPDSPESAAKAILSILEAIQDTHQEQTEFLMQNLSFIESLVRYLIRDDILLGKILDKVPDSWFGIIWQMTPIKSSEVVARSLARRPWPIACGIRLNTIKRGNSERVWKEYQLASQKWDLKTFRLYYLDVLEKHEVFKQRFGDEFWKFVPLQTTEKNDITWFLDEMSIIKDPDVLQTCLKKMEMAFNLSQPDDLTVKQLQQFHSLSEKSSNYTSKKVNFMLWSLSSSVKETTFEETLQTWQSFYKVLPPDQKLIWQKWWLKHIFKQSLTKENHQAILKFLYAGIQHSEVLRQYVHVMSETIHNYNSAVVLNLLLWSLFLASEEDSQILQGELIESYFYLCKDKEIKDIEIKILEITSESNRKQLELRWQQFLTIWHRKQTVTSSIFRRIRRWFFN